tara:strand:- start:54 stop:650 length:597 start_codon:yes stop_codon:yes gene_type:complete
MIEIIKNNNCPPYLDFFKYYNDALSTKQKNIEAICISSYNKNTGEVESRYVNLKYINNDEWIFFSNYESPKSNNFFKHPQISALFYWQNIDVQIRIKARISKTDQNFSDLHFEKRDRKKNALAISSKQSMKIESYTKVKENFLKIYNSASELKRPSHWGGFTFVPYYFEFWEGHKSRLNKRKTYTYLNEGWKKEYLQP